MDTELKAKWMAALRSGEYRQTTNTLCDELPMPSYCCLGVLCVIAKQELDSSAYNWLTKTTRDYGPFVEMNDDQGKTFPEIADYIEKNL